MIGTRVCDETWGFGTIIAETDTTWIIKYDGDPWGYHEIRKEGQ